jgi:putative ABC transport system ATP-binding protein
VLLADEPTGSLDTVTSDAVIEVLAALPGRFGTAVVLVTHEPRFASWADRVVYLRDGLIVSESVPAPVAGAATTVPGAHGAVLAGAVGATSGTSGTGGR